MHSYKNCVIKHKKINNEQLKYAAPKLYELSNWKEGSVRDHYRRGSYRIGTINNGNYRIQE